MGLRIVAFALAGLWVIQSPSLFAQNWSLVETRRTVKPDRSHTPAEWRLGEHSVAALKQWVDNDRRRQTIAATCSWQGIPGGIAPGASFAVSVKIDQSQNTQTGYDTWVKLYPGEEGGNEGDGPSASASWREGAVAHTDKATLRAPRGGSQRYYIRAQCKVAGDYHETIFYYRFAPGAAQVQVPPVATPTPPAAPAAASAVSWTGDWSTNFGAMQLTQRGSHVSGAYDYRGGRLEGELVANVLRGRWTQDNASGHFVFQLSADGRRFDGRWGRGTADSDGGVWQGSR
ncbi:MAG: hypothetical protein JNL19_13310 [Burkholderiales bacterium]|nr:hypothetical protein [Burkholderiales bacterium]